MVRRYGKAKEGSGHSLFQDFIPALPAETKERRDATSFRTAALEDKIQTEDPENVKSGH
jgi:hypothetical protein